MLETIWAYSDKGQWLLECMWLYPCQFSEKSFLSGKGPFWQLLSVFDVKLRS